MNFSMPLPVHVSPISSLYNDKACLGPCDKQACQSCNNNCKELVSNPL